MLASGPRPEMSRVAPLVIVSRRPRLELADASRDLSARTQDVRREELLERHGPRRPVGPFPCPDLGAPPLAELLPREAPRLVQRHRDAEHATLPRRREHELPVAPWRRRRAGEVQRRGHEPGPFAFATPIIASRVTSLASSSSASRSVPAGRSGRTR